jgi:hypothetical protein
MLEVTPMLFSSNHERMKRTAHATRKVRRRPNRRPTAGWKPAVECLEERTLLSLFAPAVNYPTGNNLIYVAVGDFNGDSKLDIAATNFGSKTVSVLLGNGDGTFQPRIDTSTSTAPWALGVDDFNADGKLDLAVAMYADGQVTILLGNGDGHFHASANIATPAQPSHVAVGDFNGDNKQDFATANAISDTLSVALGNGNGTFQPAVNYQMERSPVSVSAGDFNGDGKLDLAVLHQIGGPQGQGNFVVLLGNGDGTFKKDASYFAGQDNATDGTTMDLNHDGKLDLVAPNRNFKGGPSGVSVLLGNGDGTFKARVQYPVDPNPWHVALDDFNGDGNVDIATVILNTDKVGVLLGNGDGTFQAVRYYATGDGPVALASGDFNGDGAPDLAVANNYTNPSTVSVLLNTSSTTLPSLSIADTSVKENPLGTNYASFAVTLSAASDQTVTVHYDTAPGTAKPGIDYVGRHGTLTFLPGQTTRQVRVHILNDQPTGTNEQFFVNLNNPVNATIADSQAVGTIVESGSSAPSPGSSPSAPASSHSSSDRSALASDQGALVTSFVASRSPHSGQVATMAYGTATTVVGSVGRHDMLTFLSGRTAPLRTGSHAVLSGRHAVDTLFANDAGETGL